VIDVTALVEHGLSLQWVFMKSLLWLRISAWVGLAALGAMAIANLIADALSPDPLRYADLLTPLPTARVETACRAAAVSFERSDFRVDCAVARAAEALNTTGSARIELNRGAQIDLINVLTVAPYKSKLWLALALLQERLHQPNGEALKMSYLTGPGAVELIRPRLTSAVSGDALVSSDLKELAAGDIRLILMLRPDMKDAIMDAYRRASSSGKAFIEDRTHILEPEFFAPLKNAK
jgi:hypothetical protein